MSGGDYGRVRHTFWTDPDIKRALSPEQKALLLYFFTSPHRTLQEFFGNRILRWDRQSGQVRAHVGTGRPGRSADGTPGAEAEIKTPDGVCDAAR